MTDKRPYSRHGKNALMARIKLRGLGAIDKRTAAARALIAWQKELLEKYGEGKRALVDLAVRTRLYLDALDSYLLSQESLVVHKRRAVLPALQQRMALADSLAKYLSQLENGKPEGGKHLDLPAAFAGMGK
jgi:hypothetical protein